MPAGGVVGTGLRATVVSACGTGKTLMGVHTAQRVARAGRVLVLVPTLDLLVQTVSVWRGAGRTGRMVAVCSLQKDPDLDRAGVRCTTDWRQVRGWAGSPGQVTVFATYASLRVLADAHGAGLGRWDLVIVDEAHRRSGPWGKPWAAIHPRGPPAVPDRHAATGRALVGHSRRRAVRGAGSGRLDGR
ncbi:DEAD/DEAH box helicase family protein [Streptomyces sp. NPDC004244]